MLQLGAHVQDRGRGGIAGRAETDGGGGAGLQQPHAQRAGQRVAQAQRRGDAQVHARHRHERGGERRALAAAALRRRVLRLLLRVKIVGCHEQHDGLRWRR